MSKNKDIQDLIDAYLKGELQGKELVDFENQMVENPALKTEVNKAKAVQKLVIQHKLLDVKDLVKAEEAKLRNRKNTITKNIVIGILGASLISGAAVYVLNKEQQNNNIKPTEQKKDVLQTVRNKETVNVETEETSETQEKKPVLEPAQKTTDKKSIQTVKTKDTTITQTPIVVDTVNKESVLVSKAKISETKEQENNKPVVSKTKPINPCDTTKIELRFSTNPSCKGKKEGAISIYSTEGGTAPYQKTLFNASGEEVYSFSELASGKYQIHVSDKYRCKTNIEAIIQEKNCPINDHFNPSAGEVWEIPTSGEPGKIRIYTQNGVTIYEQQMYKGESYTWDGFGNSGILDAGYYIFVIEYTNGQRLKGSITIVE